MLGLPHPNAHVRDTAMYGGLRRELAGVLDRYRGTSLIRNCPPPSDCHRAPGILLLYGGLRRELAGVLDRYRGF